LKALNERSLVAQEVRIKISFENFEDLGKLFSFECLKNSTKLGKSGVSLGL
jgi:hypothetical protein